jgi:hypothetical protein
LHLLVSVSEFAHSGGRPVRLVPPSIEAEENTESRSQPLMRVTGQGTASLLIHRPASGARGLLVEVLCTAAVPLEGARPRPITSYPLRAGMSVTGTPRTTSDHVTTHDNVNGEQHERIIIPPTSPWS